jgi:hypothetical protein
MNYEQPTINNEPFFAALRTAGNELPTMNYEQKTMNYSPKYTICVKVLPFFITPLESYNVKVNFSARPSPGI